MSQSEPSSSTTESSHIHIPAMKPDPPVSSTLVMSGIELCDFLSLNVSNSVLLTPCYLWIYLLDGPPRASIA
jgi:hypothetical protein